MELGQLRASLPIKALSKLLPEVKNKRGNQIGTKPWFDNEGKVALQFLKMHEGCSDQKLLQRINTDWSLQLFCGIQLGWNEENAFHEGNRLLQGICFHQKHFGKLRQVGADAIYATNKNRKFCKRFHIATCFKPKGKRKQNQLLRKQEDLARQAIGKVRSTVLEGSYGNDKNHYNLRKVKARNQTTEISYIFFGMMTANAMKIAKRRMAFAHKPPNPKYATRAA
ncbi:MAG: transposase [Bacteroidota bacterium]